MTFALLASFLAALCYGVGSLLQAIGADRRSTSVLAVTRSLPYLAGIGLDVIAFAVSLVALRRLPLFSVQAIIASSVVVTALLARVVLGLRLGRAETIAVTAVCAGLVLLGLSSTSAPSRSSVPLLPEAVLMVAVLVWLSGAVTLRKGGSGPMLGLFAGLAFGLLGLSVRLLAVGSSLASWLVDPIVYALPLCAAMSLFFYAAALQRAHVTTTTALVVTLDVLVPAAVGVVLLGDRAASGRGWVAILGFVLALSGAVVLARSGAAANRSEGISSSALPLDIAGARPAGSSRSEATAHSSDVHTPSR